MPTKDEVLKLVKKGWKVFPCGEDKKPRTKRGHNDASNSYTFINQWWNNQNWNVGVATGKASGGLVIVDCDLKPQEDIDGLANFKQFLQDNNIVLTETLTARSGGGGTHYYFKSDKEITNKQNFLGIKGIDVRANGGYIIAPPSKNDKGLYTWTNDCEVAELPKELEEILVNYKAYKKELVRKERAKNSKEKIPKEIKDKKPNVLGQIKERYKTIPYIQEGERNTTLFELGCLLIETGISPITMREALQLENEQKCDPPLSSDDIERTADSVETYYVATKRISKINSLFEGYLEPTSIAIYFYLWSISLRTLKRKVYVSQTMIAKAVKRRDYQTVKNYIEQLEQNKLIKISKSEHKYGGYSCNTYTLL